MKKMGCETGTMSLEASICLTLFIFVLLFMYSFFVVFEARNAMAHAGLATADSLALDVYETSKVEGTNDISTLVSSIYHAVFPDNSPFSSHEKWYTRDAVDPDWNGNIYASDPGDGEDDDYENGLGDKAYVSALFASVLRERFFSYLAGSDNTRDVEAILKKYHISSGMNSVDFSKSKIVNGDLYVIVSYKLDYEFNIMNLFALQLEQTACSKLWK